MGEEVTKLIWTFVSLFVTASVLTLAIGLGQLSAETSRNEQRQTDTIALMREYREYNIYNNPGLSTDQIVFTTADVIAAIMRYQGSMEIEVTGGATTKYFINRARYGPDSEDPPTSPRPPTSYAPGTNPAVNPYYPQADYNINKLSSDFETWGLTAKKFNSKLVYDAGGTVVRVKFILKP